MKRLTRLALLLTVGLCTASAFAQSPDDQTEEAATIAPVAFVYVSNITNPTNNSHLVANVYAYTAAANGKLTPVSGSPFKDSVFTIGANGKYLFGVEADRSTIASFLMEPNGALNKVESLNTATHNPGGCGTPGDFNIDHSGAMLYNVVDDPDCFGTHFQYLKINDTNGKLEYMGETSELETSIFQIAFLGNNKYGYSPVCTIFDHEEVGTTVGLHRLNDGDLSEIGLGNLGPVTPQEGNDYCPYFFATDPTNHMAALLQDEDSDGDLFGKPVIAVYTAGANGKLTTTSTYKNMPVSDVGAFWMRMAPSGKLLAVGGQGGLEIFHFNGANPVTKYKTLLANQTIDQFYWDKDNHLYVIEGNANSPGHGKLYVYTVTPTSVAEAPGSPYTIPNAAYLAVQPR